MTIRVFAKQFIQGLGCLAWAAAAYAVVPSAHFQTAPPTYTVGAGPFYVVTANLRGMAGRQDVIVSSPNFNGGGGNTISVLLSNGDGTYQPAVNYATGNIPIGIAVGDFNKDGRPDVAVANFGSNTVSILLGNGNGTLQAQTTINVGVNPGGIFTADLNKDGNLDLVVTNTSLMTPTPCASSSITILLGNGDGTFTPAAGSPLASDPCPIGVAIVDLNKDGNLDLVVANSGGMNSTTTGTISVFLGNGNGTFGAAVNYPVLVQPFFIGSADFNSDGNPDVVVSNQGAQNTGAGGGLSILFGNGDGTLQPAVNNISVTRPQSVTVADVNLDNKPDLVVASHGGGVSILFGNGNGTFQPIVNYAVSRPDVAAVQDLNNDGKPDIVVTNENNPGTVSVMLNNGDGTFPAPRNYTVGIGPRAVAVGDLNNDGKADLVTGNGNFCGNNMTCTGPNLSVLLGKGDGTFQTASGISTASATSTSSVAIADFNGDGKPDLVEAENVPSPNNGGVKVLRGNGDGTFGTPLRVGPTGNPFGVAVADFNADNKLDFVATNFVGTVGVALNNGTPGGAISFAPPTGYGQNTAFPQWVAAADFNGDGKPDLAIAQSAQFSPGTDAVSILLNNGSGGFPGPQMNLTAGQFPASVVSGDFNNDGKPDLAVVNAGTNNVSIFLNTGNVTTPFPSTPNANYSVGTGTNSQSISVGDFNGDGFLDLVVANQGSNNCSGNCPPNTISVLLGNGDGTFVAAVNYVVPGQPGAVAAADFNGDGFPDIAVGDQSGNAVTILLNTGGTLVNLNSSANPSSYGQSVTFTARVNAGVPGSGVPTGTVTFRDNGVPLGAAVPLSSGQAVFSTSALTVSSHPITATYSGDSNFDPHTSTATAQLVVKAATSATVTSSVNPSATGQNTTLTATVTSSTSGVPTGNVQFLDGGSPLGAPVALSPGGPPNSAQAALVQSFSTAGLHSITAMYSGDPNFNGRTSPVLGQSVNSTGTTATTTTISNIVVSNPTPGQKANTVHLKQTITVTVTVTTAAGTLTGNVALTDNGAPLGANMPLPGIGSTQMVTSVPLQVGLGQHSIVATYFGDATFQTSSSAGRLINHTPKPR